MVNSQEGAKNYSMTWHMMFSVLLIHIIALPILYITIIDIYRSVVPFVLVMILALAIIMLFPQLALWLPNYIYSR